MPRETKGVLLAGDGLIDFWCPGCQEMHSINVGDPLGVLRGGVGGWTFDNNYDKPTFSPSVLVTGGHHCSPPWQPGQPCWCTYNAEHPDDPSPFKCERCHSFVRAGRIEFLADCSHPLAGQTVDLTAPPAPAPLLEGAAPEESAARKGESK